MRRAPISVKIEGLGPDLRGWGVDDRGRRWSIRNGPPGGTVLAVGKPKNGIRFGLVSPAEDAVAPRCALFGTCGGCQLQEVPLDRQRREKHAALAALLEPLGGVDHGIVGPPAAYGWRTKLELGFGAVRYLSAAERAEGDDAPEGDDEREQLKLRGAGRWLGFHAPGRYDKIVDAPRCEIASEAVNRVIAAVRRDLATAPEGWPCWDARTFQGFFRHLVLREGADGRVLAAIYTGPGDDEQAAWLATKAPGWGADAVLWFESTSTADAAIGTLRATLVGEPTVVEALGGVTFRLSPTAFFQVNRAGAELLVAQVRRWLVDAGVRTLWDLYCGTGAIGLACAGDVDAVVGVEANAEAVEDARRTAVENGIAHATFLAGEVEKVCDALTPARPLGVVVDPPRAGLHPRALGFVAGLDAEVLVYVACRPASLLRDGLLLREAGWVCTDRLAVDLFPQTAHVEVVSRWVRAR